MTATEKARRARLERLQSLYAKERTRLEWLAANPTRVTWAVGRLGQPGTWGWTDSNHVWREADGLREAIDAAEDHDRALDGQDPR